MADNGLRGPWPGPKGMIPEPVQNAADANLATRRYLDAILIRERLIGATEADLTLRLFGKTFSSPIMTPAFSHLNEALKKTDPDRRPMREYARAAADLNLVNFVGMESDETMEGIFATGASTIRIIKPFADHDRILEQIRYSKEHGAFGVGIDIDHVFGTDGSYDVVDGFQMGPVTEEDLKAYVQAAAPLPFLAKGVLGYEDALLCRQAGCAGIVVSHHHGRMPFAAPPLVVLPEILRALGKARTMKVLVDCSIDDGRDAFKALALGADAVSVGRGILRPLLSGGTPAVEEKITQMNGELKQLMGYTGIKNLAAMTPDVLILPD